MSEWFSQVNANTVLASLLAFVVPNVIGFILSLVFRMLGRGDRVRRNRAYRLISSSIGITAFLIGLVSCLGTIGVDTNALVASFGLTGLALGLALKDAVSNFIAGLMIILYSPFDLGDEIEVVGSRGKVNNMDLRYVSIDSETENVLVPNSTFLNSVVKRKKTVPTQDMAEGRN